MPDRLGTGERHHRAMVVVEAAFWSCVLLGAIGIVAFAVWP